MGPALLTVAVAFALTATDARLLLQDDAAGKTERNYPHNHPCILNSARHSSVAGHAHYHTLMCNVPTQAPPSPAHTQR